MRSITTILLNLNFVVCCVYCYSLNTNDVIFISEESVKNTYFSYTLLLQSGETVSSLIIGAPRNNNNVSLGGDIYKCDIGLGGGTSCVQYSAGRTIPSSTTNGNFFGMSLDGDEHVNGPLVACAPRTVAAKNINLNYLRGYCIYMKNSSEVTKRPMEIQPLNNGFYHDSNCCDSLRRRYYDFAFAMAGFDVSFYSEKKQEVLLGAPGIKKFNGATISFSIDNQGIALLPAKIKPVQKDDDTYFGYSVATAKFNRDSNDTWYIAGAPRGNFLKGEVTIYYYDLGEREKAKIVKTFSGETVGSYFGASILALDITNDTNVDLLIGAPMTPGKTWDEGCVYFYTGFSKDSFLKTAKLTGSSQNGSRFGSAIVSLGDFDLDGYNDVAISAPYEDDGRGAVYIYRGSSKGLTDQYSQRLSPIDFNVRNKNVKGFGMGISKGNDIDGNGHNDIAIGAYKSDQVFIIKSYSIIDYEFSLTSSISTIINDTEFDMKFCLSYTKRSKKNILPHVTFNVSFDLDYRSVEGKIVDHIDAKLGETMCKNYNVRIGPTITDILPFHIDLEVNSETADIIAHGAKSLEHKIPYSHGCGSDNICVTDLRVEIETDRQEVVLGLHKQLNLNVKVANDGEPAYQCEVKIEVSDGIELKNYNDCSRNGRIYNCLVDERLIGFNEKDYIFEIKNVQPDIPAIEMAVEVTSLFKNKGDIKNKASLKVPIILDSTPFLTGTSLPDNAELEIRRNISDLEVVHLFTVGKTGPSPLQLNVDILLPVVKYNDETIFNILEVKGNIDTIEVPCKQSIIQDGADFEFIELSAIEIPLNRTILVSCATEHCQRYTCQGEYLHNSDQVALLEARILIRSNLLVSKYKSELATKDLVALLPVIFQNSPSGRVGASALFKIFVHGAQYIPLWVFITAPAAGIILLLVVSYGLYKCNFFDRAYKEKLDQENKLLVEDNGTVEEEIFDDVVFRTMEEKGTK